MAKQITIEYFGVKGTGETVAKAKQDAGHKIERCFAEGFAPTIVSLKDRYNAWALVMRADADHWGYRIYEDVPAQGHGTALVMRASPFSMGHNSRENAILSARRHLAQWVMKVHDDTCTGLEFLAGEPKEARDHLEYIAWQRSYRRLREQGLSDVDAHDKATYDMSLVAGIQLPQ